MKNNVFSYDSACFDLAKHFYPEYPDAILALLAQDFQDAAEDFRPKLRRELEEMLAARSAAETSGEPR
jgi:hypothetical protein